MREKQENERRGKGLKQYIADRRLAAVSLVLGVLMGLMILLGIRYSRNELIYRTGDLGRYNERGELMFLSRKDYQIKHMGHRIELGEIEMLANRSAGVECSCCIFDKERSKIILYYVGAAEESALLAELKSRLPRYMLPGAIRRISAVPLTANGKIDRLALMALYQQEGN